MAGSAPGAARLVRGPRERDPQLVPVFEETARLLAARGRVAQAGWLLASLVDVELRRPGQVAPPAQRIALQAAAAMAKGGDPVSGAELAAAAGDLPAAGRLLRRAGQDAAARALTRRGGARLVLGAPLEGLVGRREGLAASQPGGVRTAFRQAMRWLEAHDEAARVPPLAGAVGLHRLAARVARGLGEPALAAEHWALAGAPLEAGRAWLEAGRDEQALEQLVLVPLDHPRHRVACVLAARIARRTGQLPFELDHLLGPFLRSPPRDEAELLAFRHLAELYAGHDMLRSAVEVLDAALSARPDRRELAQARDALRRRLHDPGHDREVVAQDAAFHGRLARDDAADEALGDLGDLPELPELPELPDLATEELPTVARPDVPAAPTIAPDLGASLPPSGRAAATMVPDGNGRAGGARTSYATFMDSSWGGTGPGLPSFAAGADERGEEDAREPFAPGALIDGRYRIEGQLGEGGMGAVFQARDEELDEDIALKVLTVPVRNTEMIERFRRELRLARRLSHPNVVRLHDMGVHQGFRYITMELLVGADLRRRLEEGIPKRTALELVAEAARALDAAHARDVVHRDVKPENLFVEEDGTVKIMDFGLARTGDTSGVTLAGMVAGTPAYMAPEQGSSFATAGAPADQYALGIITYEVIMGGPPFRHAELLPLLRMHAEAPVPSILDAYPTLPLELDEVIQRALAKVPEDRFPSCLAFAEALEGCL